MLIALHVMAVESAETATLVMPASPMTPAETRAPREFANMPPRRPWHVGERMNKLLWVCLGGAVGSGARYLVSGWALRALGTSFPYGTLVVNLLGSFLLALLMFAGVEAGAMSPAVRLGLSAGVMGGFTTYATFSYETMTYLQEGAWGVALGNVLVTVIGCLLAALAGWAVARALFGV